MAGSDDKADPAPDRTVIGPEDGLPAEPARVDRTVAGAAERPDAERTVISDAPDPAAVEARLVEPGTLINNNYRITALISAGGMGEVYRAENIFTGDPVAVKVILPGLAGDGAVLDMFRREARVLVQLRDDAIVRYHNFVLDGGLQRYCLIMEFVAGRHLGTRVKEDGPLRDAEALTLMRRLARGLARAHASGVTHRDLSPDNVILRDDRIEEAVLIDFGIARSTELGDGLAGRFAGKFKYIAPEQLGHWGGEAGPRADVYGLALLMATVVRGLPLDMGDSVVSASAARLVIPDLSGISHRLFPVLQHMLEPDPMRRPPDMAAVLRILDDPISLPAQYRLPLWYTGGGTGGDGGMTTMSKIDLSALQTPEGASISPFAGVSAPDAAPPDIPEKPRRWILPVAAIAAMVLAGAGVLMMRGDPAPAADAAAVPAAPAQMAPRDLATREGWLADYPLPACALATRPASGPDAGTVAILSQTPVDAAPMLAAYEQTFAARPAVVPHPVTAAQCPVVDFLRAVAGRAPLPALTADVAVSDGAIGIRGEVSAEGRNLWLFLVSPGGGVYDLTAQAQPGPGGASAFAVSVDPGAEASDAPYLLVALGSVQPLASVSAAPAGAGAADLMPRVLAELASHGDAPAADVLVFAVPDTP